MPRQSLIYYIRFGEIPESGRSRKGNGVIGDGYECAGYEEGVSVWECVKSNGRYCGVFPGEPTRFTLGDFSRCFDPDSCCGSGKDDKIYIVDGDEIGKGADGEPLLR